MDQYEMKINGVPFRGPLTPQEAARVFAANVDCVSNIEMVRITAEAPQPPKLYGIDGGRGK